MGGDVLMKIITEILSFIVASLLATLVLKVLDLESFRYLGYFYFFLFYLITSAIVLSPIIITSFFIKKDWLIYYSFITSNLLFLGYFIAYKLLKIPSGSEFLHNLLASIVIWLITGLLSIIIDKRFSPVIDNS
jgi:hypothetical protein